MPDIDPDTIPRYTKHLENAQERDEDITVILDVTEEETNWIKETRKGRKKK
jgi:hypothetical protein|tara:strand:+ start:832 stop:984 length:153 start_codon:yes stop_codon:yes gene_type:complete